MSRVLLLIKSLDQGGAQRLLIDSVRASGGRFEYQVAYIVAGRDALVPELEQIGVNVHCLGDGMRWPWNLRRLIQRDGIDLVHVHSPYAAVGARLWLPRRTPIVYTEHNVWSAYHLLTRWANAATFARNDHVFAVSNAVRDSVRPARGRSVETVYHGLYERPPSARGALRRELGVGRATPLVGTVAEFRREKGHEHLLLAAAEVRRSVPDVRFILIGDGPLERAMRGKARTLNLNGTMVFTGHRADAGQAVGDCDAFVLASLQEGLPIALLEAMAQRRAVVVSDRGGLGEVVRDGWDGLVVSAGDVGQLSGAIIRLLADRPLRERLGDAAAQRVLEFDMRTAINRIEAVYDALLCPR